jgi:TfoX/Sxy family transcriptional regulator of competence genes
MTYNERLATRMRASLGKRRGLQEKKLFGGIGFLVNGNMACGVHKDELILRLSDEDYEAAMKSDHVRMFNISGRPMKGWVLVAAPGVATDKALGTWIRKSIAFAKSLPPKE